MVRGVQHGVSWLQRHQSETQLGGCYKVRDTCKTAQSSFSREGAPYQNKNQQFQKIGIEQSRNHSLGKLIKTGDSNKQTAQSTRNLLNQFSLEVERPFQEGLVFPSSQQPSPVVGLNILKGSPLQKLLDPSLFREKLKIESQLDTKLSSNTTEDAQEQLIDRQAYHDFYEDENQAILRAVLSNDLQNLVDQLQKIPSSVHRKAMVNKRCSKGRTPIFYAIYGNQYEMCEVLLRNGAETLYKDVNGRTILHLACSGPCDRKMLQLVMDYKQIQDQQKLHCLDALHDKFKGKNYDRVPQNQGVSRTSRSSFQEIQKVLTRGDSMADNMKLLVGVIEEQEAEQHSILGAETSSEQQEEVSKELGKPHANSNMEEFKIKRLSDKKLKVTPGLQSTLKRQGSTEDIKNLQFEASIKNTHMYRQSINKYVNFTDQIGKTPLHYAVDKDDIQQVGFLCSRGANPYVRDHKLKKPLDLAKSRDMQKYLEKVERAFQEVYLQKKKKKEELRLNLSGSSIASSGSHFTSMTLFNKTKLNKNLELGSIEQLAQYTNSQLSLFCYGIYSDNALSYMMRVNDSQKFEYLLKRGLLPSASDSEGCSTLHYAIRMERIEYLSFLFEGDYLSHLENQSPIFQVTLDNVSMTKSCMQSTMFQSSCLAPQQKLNYQLEALLSLDKCSITEGHTPFHEAAIQGNVYLLQYLIKVFKKRNEVIREKFGQMKKSKLLSQQVKHKIENLKEWRDILEFTDRQNMTPLFLAVKHGQTSIVQLLIQEGANPYLQCSQLLNPLHYAVTNQNEELIKLLLYCDQESSLLKNERNSRNQKPEQLDKDKRYSLLFNNVWELSTQRNQNSMDRIHHLLKLKEFSVDQQTLVGGNTPLHFAVIYNNIRALRVMMQMPESQRALEIYNSDGLTPRDLALMWSNDEIRNRLVLMLNKDLNHHLFSYQPPDSPTKLGSPFGQLSTISENIKIKERRGTDLEAFNKEKVTNFHLKDNFHGTESNSPLSQLSPKLLTKNDSSAYNIESPFEIQRMKEDQGHSTQSLASRDKLSERPIIKTREAMQHLRVNTKGDSFSSNHANQITFEAQKASLSFIKMKQDQYQNEKRLGNFNPAIYVKHFGQNNEKSAGGYSSPISRLSIHSHSGLVIQRKRSVSRKTLQIEQLFQAMDTKRRNYVYFHQIMAQWAAVEDVIGNDEGDRLKLCLERFYRETKVSKTCFLKLMEFYINEA